MAGNVMDVLIVDDDKFIRLVVTTWLHEMGHSVTNACDGKEALNYVNEFNYDFIICDIEMPGMNGFELVESIRKITLEWIPIAYLSNLAQDKNFQKGIHAGGDFYLCKPLDEVVFGAFITGIERLYDMRTQVKNLSHELEQLRDHTNDGIVSIKNNGLITNINRSGAKMFGYNPHELFGKDIHQILPQDLINMPDNTSNIFPLPNFVISDSQEYSGICKNGDAIQLDISITKIDNNDRSGYTGIIRDITSRKKMENELRNAAQYDSLTGLAGRTLVSDRINQRLAQFKRNQSKFALLFIDLDHFKDINDTLGHEWGDKLLILAANKFKQCLRSSDTVARFAGDEFIIILDEITETHDIETATNKILNEFRKPFILNNKDINVTISIGISISSEEIENQEEMIKQADLAMYKGKEHGRNQFCFYSSELDYIQLYRMELSAALSLAVKNMEFSIHYQPQIDATTGNIIGAEALMRWTSHKAGFISPGIFIPLLEDTGLIVQVTEWLIDTSIAQWKKWIDSGVVSLSSKLSVNLSAKNFMSHKVDEVIMQSLKKHDLKNSNLCVEITESIMIADSDRALKILEILSDNGVSVALDDFGTGYSSLLYLSKYPIDIIKIDHTFIARSQESNRGKELVMAIIEMSHKLKLPVIAEGVDTDIKKNFLLENGCDVFQGFLFAKALPVLEFEEYVNDSLANQLVSN